MSVSLTLNDINKVFMKDGEKFHAVQNVDLSVTTGEFLTFLGPSGCGKTTTLRMVAGFEMPTSGRILMGDADITTMPANERNIGFVFQNYALFPHMKIFENVAYGLKVRGLGRAEIAQKYAKGWRSWGWKRRKTATLTSSQAANSSAWHWRAYSCCAPSCC